MRKTASYMPRPGHTCRVRKTGDPWDRKQVAVTVVSNTGRSVCALWSALGTALRSPQGSPARDRVAFREYMPNELIPVHLFGIQVGKSYAFVREGHDWTGCEVIVVSDAKRGFKVARCCEVSEWLFGKKIGVKEPKSWTAKASELW